MSKSQPEILQPFKSCQWNSRTVDRGVFWEFGGSIKLKDGYGPAYVLIAPDHIPITTIGLRSLECRRGFDHLYIRIGALDACNLGIEPHTTRFFFVDKEDGMTSKSNLSQFDKGFTNDALSQMIRRMYEQADTLSVTEIKTYITSNKDHDWQNDVPLKPYQQHLFVYRGLKLGQFISDHIDADPKLLDKLENDTGNKLPDDYRSFILETNGGSLKNRVFFKVKGNNKPRQLSSFIRFNAKSDFSLPQAHYEFDPDGFLCIARDTSDKHIYLGIDPSIHGHVYWLAPKAYDDFYHQHSLSPSERARIDGLHLLGSSFSDFIDRLERTDDLC